MGSNQYKTLFNFIVWKETDNFFLNIFFIVKERHAILTFISILKSQMTRLVIYLF